MIQLPRILYLAAELCDGSRTYEEIADELSHKVERSIASDDLAHLVDQKLRPLGVVANPDGSSPPMEKIDPLLGLRFRTTVIPERWSQRIALLFKPLFLPPVVLAALAGLAVFDAWLFLDHGVAQSFRHALYEPTLLVLVFALVVVSAGWHEFGHAAGCAYGGARPGAMGAGIYIAYPAFYTDVTDAYRLDRRGRLRTDLAGIYFNDLFILATAAVYAVTGIEALLLVIVVQHFEVVHQLLPIVRLDGYYIVADLTGVPDLFARIRPILASALPGHRSDPRVTELKTSARVVVTLWTVVVVPLLLFQLVLLLLHAPRLFATGWDSLSQQSGTVTASFGEGDLFAGLAGMLQMAIVAIPLLGIGLTFARLGSRAGQTGWKATTGRPVRRGAFVLAGAAALAGLAYVWLPNGDYEPIRRGERGTLTEGIAAIRTAATGRSGMVAHDRAAARGDLDATADPAPAPAGATTTVPTLVPTTTDGTGTEATTTTVATTTTRSSATTTTVRSTTTTARATTTTQPPTTTTIASTSTTSAPSP